MSNRRVRLADIAELTVGYVGNMAKQYKETGVKFLRSLNIKPFHIVEDDLKYISKEFSESLSKSILHENDLIIVRTGMPGTCCVVPKEYENCNCADVVIVRPNLKKVNPHYLAAYINVWGKKQVENNKVGAIQKHFNVKSAEEMVIDLPDLEQQYKVAKVLTDLNGKIFINEKINDYLEAMAKTIYDYWFVQFDFPNENGKPYESSGGKMVNSNGHIIPEGWTFCKIQDIISNICTGLNPRDNFKLGTGDIKYITVKNLTPNGTLDFTGCDTIDESARTIVHNRSDIQIGDILFASIAPLGRCYLIQSEPTDWDINESVFSIRANTDIITPAFLYLYFMSDAFIKHATSSSTGSIFKGIRINTLLETELCVPPLAVILKFEERLASIFPLKSKNYEEIQRLSNLRDWLLPMLMNGQATIEDCCDK
ncbi:restriction endonuclease subunit S [Tyzzerella nexilis]|nr:restriction endonuclease subunit S [[Clostridium] nexile]